MDKPHTLSMLDLEFTERTSTGLVRENNEDTSGFVMASTPDQRRSQGWFFCVADGMGAHAKGEVASNLAVETACKEFRTVPKGVMHVSLLPRLVQQANIAVYDAGHEKGGEGNGMGTTIVCCALRFDSAVIAHVGDSRCYLMRNGKLTQLTHDHTLHNEHVRLGILAAEDAGSGEGKHILTRSLGQELFVAADTLTVNVVPGDLLLLCTDGVHGYLPEVLLSQMLASPLPVERLADALIEQIYKAGAPDNATLQLIRINTVERMGLYRGRPYRLL